MTTTRGRMLVAPDMAIKGSVNNCQAIEVQGYLEGEITAQSVVIGRCSLARLWQRLSAVREPKVITLWRVI